MSRYAGNMFSVSVSAQKTLVEITAASDAIVIVHEAWISQDASETSTQEVASLIRKTAAGTGTSYTVKLLAPNTDAAFGGTCRTDCTAEGTLGDEIVREGFNILNGWYYKPVPDARPTVPPSGIIGIRFAVAPAAAITVSAGIIFEENG